jgi:hypothetical protein
MADCRQTWTFLQGVSAKSVTGTIPDADLGLLQEHGLVELLTSEQAQQLQAEVAQLEAAQHAIEEEQARQEQEASAVTADTRRTHSILFHLQGVDKEEATVDRLHEEQAALQSIEGDLAKREADFAQLLVKRGELDRMSPYDGRFVAITTAGRVALRDLAAALYRVGDEPFSSYWTQAQAIDAELAAIVNQSAAMHVPLLQALPNVDPTYLWAVAIGLAKQKGKPEEQVPAFLATYGALGHLAKNDENRLLAAEVLTGIGQSGEAAIPSLEELVKEVEKLGVPTESAAGVGAVLVAGRRADGTYATAPLGQFLRLTPSYEAAALLAVVNKPFDDLAKAFGDLKAQFVQWNYAMSEDTELSSAYLALSGLPLATVGTKMAILARGVGAYVAYPLVAAAILASIPVLEANETLNLLEKAYEILGQRTGPMSEAELLTLAVRTIHGVNVRSVNELDPTQVQPASYPSFSYVNVPPAIWIPVFVAHGAYHATFSGIGGFHPGHVHAVGGGGWGGGFGG